MTLMKAFAAVAIVMLVLDALWLGVVARRFYVGRLEPLLAQRPNFRAAAVFYVVYVSGIVFFAVRPALDGGNLVEAATLGSLLGALCYATYELTNLATLKQWPARVVVVDIAWGSLLTGAAAAAGFVAAGTFA